MRNAALEGPLFHVAVNSRDMFLASFRRPLRGFVFLTTLLTAGAVGCILGPLRGWLGFFLFQAIGIDSTSA